MAEIITTTYTPCLNYKRDFDPDKGDKHTIYIDYTKSTPSSITGQPEIRKILSKKETIRKYEGTSAEELLYTFDTFTRLSKDLKLSATTMWNEFPKMFHHGPRKEWENMMDEQNPKLDKGNKDDLKLAFKGYLEIYTPDPQAKDTLLASFDKKFRKPIEQEVQAHWNRIDLIMDYADQLRGERIQKLTKNERKMFFYNTFPAKWRNLFATTNDLYSSTALEIKNFMLLKKRTADAEDHKNKNKNKNDNRKDNKNDNDYNPNKRSRGGRGGRGRGGRNGGRNGGRGRGEFKSSMVDGNTPCPIHPGTRHTWNQCNKNPDNPNNNNNGGGRGFQRGGRGGGRFDGRGAGRGNYYHDNNYQNYNQPSGQYPQQYQQPQDAYVNYPSDVSQYGNSTVGSGVPPTVRSNRNYPNNNYYANYPGGRFN